MDNRNASTIGALIKIALFIAAMFICIGGLGWMVVRKDNSTVPQAHTSTPGATTKPKPTRANDPTGTPAPDYHGTQAALDSAIATHQAGIDEAMRRATTTAEALAVAQQATVYSVEVSIAQTRLSGAINENDYANQLHTIVISKTVVMAQDEIDFAAWRLKAGNAVWATWNIALLIGAGLAVLAVCFAVGRQYITADKPPKEPPITERENTMIVEVDSDKKSQKFKELPTQYDGFFTWASCAVKGWKLSHRYWAVDEDTKQFSDSGYRDMMDTMKDNRWVYKKPDGKKYLTESGRRVLVAWLGEMESVK